MKILLSILTFFEIFFLSSILLSESYITKYYNFYSHKSIAKFSSLSSDRVAGVNYLNSLRSKVGLNQLIENSLLDEAAQNHANYLILNNIFSHYESPNYQGYTGNSPYDRVNYVGYNGFRVLENISAGDKDIYSSIDDLFSAIYHRLGFLDFSINEIGIGEASSNNYYYKTVYVYDMGLRNADQTSLLQQNPEYVVWPYPDEKNVTPVFYDEEPDPLPECSVSGYPVSVEFNSLKVGNINLIDFKLYDENNQIVESKILDQLSDPNGKLNEYQFVLMPLKRLDFGKKYTAEFIYKENGESKILRWSFYTKTLNNPYFVVNSNDQTFHIKSGSTYIIYFPPENCNDKFNGFSYSYQSNDLAQPLVQLLDFNTIKIKVTSISGKIIIKTNNGKNVTLLIANYDDAIYPKENLEELLAAPSSPLNPVLLVKGEPLINPENNKIVIPPDNNVIVQPSMSIPESQVGKRATLLMYIYLPQYNYDLFLKKDNVVLNKIQHFNLLPEAINLSNFKGLIFDVYYGYILNEKIYYNDYRVVVND